MDTSDVQELVSDFDTTIADLETSLAPLLQQTALASKLPLLDKAKLHVLTTYAIESILFSTLQLNGVDAKAHPVFQELGRTKAYFGKIKTAESAGTRRSTTVDTEAAGRFIKHGLAGNEKYDRERAQRTRSEKAGAKRKLEDLSGVGTHTRFDGVAKRMRADESGEAIPVDGTESDVQGQTVLSKEEKKEEKKEAKRQRRAEKRIAKYGADGDGIAEGVDGQEDGVQAKAKSSKAPRSNGETFQALLKGPLPEAEGTEKKSKRKKKKSLQALEDRRADEMK